MDPVNRHTHPNLSVCANGFTRTGPRDSRPHERIGPVVLSEPPPSEGEIKLASTIRPHSHYHSYFAGLISRIPTTRVREATPSTPEILYAHDISHHNHRDLITYHYIICGSNIRSAS